MYHNKNNVFIYKYDIILVHLSGQETVLLAVRDAKSIGVKRPFTSAQQIQDELRLKGVPADQIPVHPTMTKPINFASQINHRRRKLRPEDPQQLQFDLNRNHLPDGFLQADVEVGASRHLIFATLAMLTLLGKACTWLVYIINHHINSINL